ncbi:double zinc ribbon domain-containing protein [Collinsella tanakaei]|uniref:double zinc ribbon domain-containing protein n=1 Tax=Collinsella tanakaei TaxID=626935 RepID=UPI001F29EA83|nr:zinc ribbon domain-containing protein [Collinsella tanakaei]MCF2620786.1 zinc ribbon domain-containing protein [Collinsella tanakaei]
MICPHCLKTIDDNETFCPHCHGYVGSSSSSEFVFCEGCGARLSTHDRTCPKCGRPAPGILSVESSSSDLAAGKTASFPRLTKHMIQTETPAVEPISAARELDDSVDPSSTNVLDRGDLDRAAGTVKPVMPVEDPYHPHRRSYRGLIIALVAIALIGGGAAFVALDPLGVMPGFYESFKNAAQEAFPSRQVAEDPQNQQTVEPVVPQGSDAVEPEPKEDTELNDDEVFAVLSDAYDKLLEYDSQEGIGEVIDSFNSYYLDPDLASREANSRTAYELRDAIQETIDELEGIEAPADTVYAEDIDHMIQLATWMYGRVDQICASWDVSLAIPEGESTLAAEDDILQPMREAGSSDLDQFDAHLGEWEPQEK